MGRRGTKAGGKRAQAPELKQEGTWRSRGRTREGAAFPAPPPLATMPPGYAGVLADLKRRIRDAQSRAALAVSRELIGVYWYVGRTIVERQAEAGWGDAVVERIAHDLRHAFPDLKGFSPGNIWRMRAFCLAWSGGAKKVPRAVAGDEAGNTAKKLPQAVAELPWGHNVLLLEWNGCPRI